MFESLANQLRGGVPDRLATVLDNDLRDTRRAMEVSLPALIGGLRDKAVEPGGAEGILEILNGPAGAPIEDVDRYLTEHDPRLGASVLDKVFGARGQTALTSLSKASGLSTRLLAQVMSMLGPVVTGWLGSKAAEEDFSKDEIRSFLEREADNLEAAGYDKVLALVSGAGVVAAGAAGGTDAPADTVASGTDAPADTPIAPVGPARPRIVTVAEGMDDDAYEDDFDVPSAVHAAPPPLSAVPSAPPTERTLTDPDLPQYDMPNTAVVGAADLGVPNPTDLVAGGPALPGAPGVPPLPPTGDYDGEIAYGTNRNWLWIALSGLVLLGLLLFVLWACNRDTAEDPVETGTETTAETQVEPQIDVQGSLTESLRPFAGVVGVVDGSTAVLTGNVADINIKNAAEATAIKVTGIDSVQNNLAIGNGNTLVDRLGITPELTLLNELVGQAGLADTLASGQKFTLFAPTDDAFNRLPAEELAALRADPTRLNALLSYHLAVGDQFTAEFLTAQGGGLLETVQGESLAIRQTEDGSVRINEVANVLLADVAAENGLIHIIDSVILPSELGGDGATQPAAPVPEELGSALGLSSISFASGSSEITDAGKAELDRVVEYLVENPVSVEVAGHTDTSGPEDGNQTLSQQRADSVRDYLIGQGVDETLLTATGYGESQPLVTPDDTDDAKAQNRRIEFNTSG